VGEGVPDFPSTPQEGIPRVHSSSQQDQFHEAAAEAVGRPRPGEAVCCRGLQARTGAQCSSPSARRRIGQTQVRSASLNWNNLGYEQHDLRPHSFPRD
jgi:hypothetical protein